MDSAFFTLKFILECVYLYISTVGWLGMIFHMNNDFFLVTQVEFYRELEMLFYCSDISVKLFIFLL